MSINALVRVTLLIWACCLASLSSQASEVLTVSAQTEQLDLNKSLVFRVTHDNFSLARVGLEQSERWESYQELRSHHSGIEEPMVWASVRLFNRSNVKQQYVVDFGDPYMEQASIYVMNLDGEMIDSASVTFGAPLISRPYLSSHTMLPIDLPANQTVWVVMAMKEQPERIAKLSLWEPKTLQLHIQQRQTALGINAGVMLLLAVAAFSLARGSRRRIQLSLGLVSSVFIFAMLLHSGIWVTYVCPYSPEIAKALLPFAKQWLMLSLAWLIRESAIAWVKRPPVIKFMNVVLGLVIVSVLVQPWWQPLVSYFWLSSQAIIVAACAFSLLFVAYKKRRNILQLWFLGLLLVLCLIAILIVVPRASDWWQGLSGLVLYTVLTVNMLALNLAMFDKALMRMSKQVNRLKRMKDYYRNSYWRFIERTGEGWFELSKDQQWHRVSERFVSLFGMRSSELFRRTYPVASDLLGEEAAQWSEPNRQESWQKLCTTERFDGKTIWLDVEIFPDGKGRAMDVTERVEAELHLNFLAKHDSLTGLLNAREITRRTQVLLDKKTPAVFIVVEIIGLQVIADQMSNNTRDQALLELSLELREKLPKGARIARLDEYQIAILVNDNEQSGFALAYQLLQQCREFRFATEHRVYQFNASAGIACAGVDTINASSLSRKALTALQLAKQAGDYRVHSATDDDQRRLQSAEEVNWEQRLKGVLANESWELYQQPIISGRRDRDKHCFEILLRLPNDDGRQPDEALAPQQFLNEALNAGVMGKADRWLIRHVMDFFSEHPFDALRTWRCHINLSLQSLEDAEFIHFLEQEIEQSALRPEQLMFEVAEPIAEQHFDRVYELFKQLKEIGAGTVIDQFGTGFNSFRLLRQLPLTQVKINRFWVQNMLLDELERELVFAAIKLATTAGVEVAAVGVESDDIRSLLVTHKVDYLQGFVCGRPEKWALSRN